MKKKDKKEEKQEYEDYLNDKGSYKGQDPRD